jgi:large subunit ribosomal protein L23
MSFLNKILSVRGSKSKRDKKPVEGKEAKVAREAEVRPEVQTGKIIAGVIQGSHITEKAASRQGTYVFKVSTTTNKTEVKRAIESRFEVKVRKVNILNMSGKERRRGKQIGWRSGFKKAVVTLKEGQTIEVQ